MGNQWDKNYNHLSVNTKVRDVCAKSVNSLIWQRLVVLKKCRVYVHKRQSSSL